MNYTRNEDEEFRRRCESLIATLPIRYPFELRAFLKAVGKQREMTVVLGRMLTGRSGTSGLLVRMRTECLLGVAAAAVPTHVYHIVFHEVGHWVLEHPGDYVCSRRTGTGSQRELEAEQFAHQLQAHVRAGTARHRDRQLPPGRTALRAAFGARRHLCADG
ncbi:hypothetical protein H4696_000265 [Amycolatopsis lexingtonensis]|uniref:IrrE N-terminal-like domain-containing protein n=1 Tax=Amycolatopsis lexingtonensis TaxID=218822 RepID=A0ABR9HQE8_9PSEU|nr:hypothetical protein [Amycolatopsis lexingtonensis]MBE1493165.1 hypothetical protein [Amycolatopsis lexingtonensis]